MLDSREIMHEEVSETVSHIEVIGKSQYQEYVKERLDDRSKLVSDTITRNKLALFSRPPVSEVSKVKSQVAALKSDCVLFTRLYIACQSRDGNLEDFFKHEN